LVLAELVMADDTKKPCTGRALFAVSWNLHHAISLKQVPKKHDTRNRWLSLSLFDCWCFFSVLAFCHYERI
jgi:hypothetical protein